ncbi:nicotinamidase-related amidase [Ancylobacter sp. 3268]|uniref:cysteine hydrolase family protein n=1 Tax=Ancylobacter sp. 3268 TaxID=2817752 RepID=UPI00285612C0|nr:cysteine hydrolase family protein [Ancylobacter sp. 3268]MDR6952241.1 nicotinamidase-related amidase [Ancylobacter sp. 3268]
MTDTALLLIDIQNDYFPGGKYPLVGMEDAAAEAARLLEAARRKGLGIVHVRHEDPSPEAGFFGHGTTGAQINPAVSPQEGEPVVVKRNVNAFLDTGLDATLKQQGVSRLVIVGAMSHMCVDAATRAALDLGYEVTVAHDATATRDLGFGGTEVPAASVQAALMAALEFAGAGIKNGSDIAESWVA